MKVTIKDIARLAGVSTATVSMVLNHKASHISEGTRERIWKIANENNYVPNLLARSLVTRKTKTLGLVMPDITNPFFPEISRGAEDKAAEAEYSIILCNTDDNPRKEEKYVRMMLEKMVDGIIFTDSANRKPIMAEIRAKNIPVVMMGREGGPDDRHGRVFVDNYKGALDATQHLIERGYRKIAMISGNTMYNTAQERLEGYRKALHNAGLPYVEERALEGTFRQEWGFGGASWLLGQKIPFDAVFCGNDMIAIGAMKAFKQYGLSIPGDVAVVGYDDVYMARMVDPELTTVSQPMYDIGYTACDMLLRMIEDPKLEEEHICFEGKLVVRQST